METRENIRQSLKERADELDRRMGRLAADSADRSADAEARLRSELTPLRTRLSQIRTHLRDKVDADDSAQDAALAQLGHELNEMYGELMSWPK